jgi:hypothetical protein
MRDIIIIWLSTESKKGKKLAWSKDSLKTQQTSNVMFQTCGGERNSDRLFASNILPDHQVSSILYVHSFCNNELILTRYAKYYIKNDLNVCAVTHPNSANYIFLNTHALLRMGMTFFFFLNISPFKGFSLNPPSRFNSERLYARKSNFVVAIRSRTSVKRKC